MTPPSARSARVLLVEDEVSSARKLAQLLREDGYEVEIVHDGAKAIERLGNLPTFDVLIVDYKLLHADGLAVAVFGRSRYPTLPVVMVSSYPEVVARLDKRLDPPAVMLTKPLEYADLMRELERVRVGRDSNPPRG